MCRYEVIANKRRKWCDRRMGRRKCSQLRSEISAVLFSSPSDLPTLVQIDWPVAAAVLSFPRSTPRSPQIMQIEGLQIAVQSIFIAITKGRDDGRRYPRCPIAVISCLGRILHSFRQPWIWNTGTDSTKAWPRFVRVTCQFWDYFYRRRSRKVNMSQKGWGVIRGEEEEE